MFVARPCSDLDSELQFAVTFETLWNILCLPNFLFSSRLLFVHELTHVRSTYLSVVLRPNSGLDRLIVGDRTLRHKHTHKHKPTHKYTHTHTPGSNPLNE